MTVHVALKNHVLTDPIAVREEQMADIDARESLLDVAFGADRFAKTSERLREGRLPADGLALVATAGERLVGTVRLWNVTLGPDCPALLLGPLAVDPSGQARVDVPKLRRTCREPRLATSPRAFVRAIHALV